MKVQIQKVNNGVNFSLLTKSGRASSSRADKNLNSMAMVITQYLDDVQSCAKENGFNNSQIESMRDRMYRALNNTFRGPMVLGGRRKPTGPIVVNIECDTWGFAFGDTCAEASMNDTGSCATDSRAKLLWCMQAPLEKVPHEIGHEYKKVVDAQGL